MSCRIVVGRFANAKVYRFGYVEFSNTADSGKAFDAMKGSEIDGRKINLDYATGRNNNNNNKDRAQARARSFGDQTSPESDTLFVGNIPFSANEQSVRKLFGGKGEIVGIRLPTEAETGRPKGYGYVQYASVDGARRAFNELNGADLNGRPVRLDYSSPRPSAANGGGFRGGRGGGFRGGRGGGQAGGINKNRGSIAEYQGKKISF